MPFFTVLIPTFNRSALLRRAIESVQAQTFRDFEIIVVDDGSTDDTATVLAEYERDGIIRACHQQNAGQSVARNVGIAHAAGEYVAFLDSDDLWFPWTLANFKRVIQEQGRLACIATASAHFKQEPDLRRVQPGPLNYRVFPDLLSYFDSGATAVLGAGFLIVRTDLLRQSGGFPATRNNSEDIDLSLRIGTASGFVVLSSPPSFGQRDHGANVSLDTGRGAAGLFDIIAKERAGKFPGGAERRRARQKVITFIARAISVAAIRAGNTTAGWELYRRCLGWHLVLGRFRYLIGFPLLALRYRFTAPRQAIQPSGTG